MRWILLALFALPLTAVSEQIDRISSAQQVEGRYVFVSAAGNGPWTLIVGVGLRHGDQPLSYLDVAVKVFDAGGNGLVVRPTLTEVNRWMEITGKGRQACGIYSVGKSPTAGEPARAEVTIYGKKVVCELTEDRLH